MKQLPTEAEVTRSEMADRDLRGRRVTVMGLGRHGGGVAATRFLAGVGARVTVTDLAPAASLMDSLNAVADLALTEVQLGGHVEESFRDAELIVVNPAVRPGNSWVELARRNGARITSEIELLMERVPCPVVGVSGSNGKSTTASMIAAILTAAGRKVWLGGNIERSLLGELPNMTTDDWVVLELSSFQLHWLSASVRLPDISVVTNCTPNHLDWHPDFTHYSAAKRRLLNPTTFARCGPPTGTAVLGPALCDTWGRDCLRTVQPLHDENLIPALKIPGLHNRINASCAAAAACAAGCGDEAITTALSKFAGLSHRLETIGVVAGRRFINDTQATTPEATMAALAAIEGACWLLCGGADKGVSFDELATAIIFRCAGVACYGAVGPQLETAIRQHNADFNCVRMERLEEAVAWCWERSSSGDAILLSPACASIDQYRDYSHRAADFANWRAR
ncbi:MAG: UDP-N-acetylmuramoyl-L-alanine--D-glutamate ligase [Planctomycetes bacterium]|nr:UDP-N-acetylmuramoyl-L-alanine--D-glutamate ligase [Planctomycetota bacterium]